MSAMQPGHAKTGREALQPGLWAWVATFLAWAIPSAWFWTLAEAQGILLPYVPRAVWMAPGEAWQASPWLFVALAGAVPWGLFAVARRWPACIRGTRAFALLLGALTVLVHAVWGSAVVLQ